MFDMNSLPVPGGIIVAGALWAGVSVFALGPVVANRTIEKTNWNAACEKILNENLAAKVPQPEIRPNISCGKVLGAFGPEMRRLCRQGGDQFFDLLTIDPLAAQKKRARQREADRLARIAALSPSRCSCAARIVGADRLAWGLYAGSPRLLGGPQNLKSDLTQALYSPSCKLHGEG